MKILSEFLHRVNPFYKFLIIGLVATGLTFVHSYRINFMIVGICIGLFLIGSRPATWMRGAKIFIPIGILALSVFMSGVIWGTDPDVQFSGLAQANTQSGINMVSRFFSFASLGILLSTTTDSFELVKAMQKNGKLPRKFAYGMMAAINLIPHMKVEYQNARLAFAVRGASVGPLSMKVIFSMLVNCFRWSEMLAIAMHSKGFYK